MPRYFFNRTDGFVDNDDEGTDLPDIQTARVQAIVYAGASLQDDPAKLWNGEDFRVEVTDDTGLLLFTVVTIGFDSPTTERKFKPSPKATSQF